MAEIFSDTMLQIAQIPELPRAQDRKSMVDDDEVSVNSDDTFPGLSSAQILEWNYRINELGARLIREIQGWVRDLTVEGVEPHPGPITVGSIVDREGNGGESLSSKAVKKLKALFTKEVKQELKKVGPLEAQAQLVKIEAKDKPMKNHKPKQEKMNQKQNKPKGEKPHKKPKPKPKPKQGDIVVAPNATNTLWKAPTNRNRLTWSYTEQIQTVTTTASDAVTRFAINPGLSASFPQMSIMAQGFELWKLKHLKVVYRSLIADAGTAPNIGSIALGWEYDPDDTAYTTFKQVEASAGAASTAVSKSFSTTYTPSLAAKPPKAGWNFVRRPVTTSDLRITDLGAFYFATTGSSSNFVCGEIWVSYTFEFSSPIPNPGYSSTYVSRYNCAVGVNGSNPLGNGTSTTAGYLPVTYNQATSSFTISGTTYPAYIVSWMAQGTSTAAVSCPLLTMSGSLGNNYNTNVPYGFMGNGISATQYGPSGSSLYPTTTATSTICGGTVIVRNLDTTGASTGTITLSTSATLPTASTVEIIVAPYPSPGLGAEDKTNTIGTLKHAIEACGVPMSKLVEFQAWWKLYREIMNENPSLEAVREWTGQAPVLRDQDQDDEEKKEFEPMTEQSVVPTTFHDFDTKTYPREYGMVVNPSPPEVGTPTGYMWVPARP